MQGNTDEILLIPYNLHESRLIRIRELSKPCMVFSPINVVTEGSVPSDICTDNTSLFMHFPAKVLASCEGRGVYFSTTTFLASFTTRFSSSPILQKVEPKISDFHLFRFSASPTARGRFVFGIFPNTFQSNYIQSS